MDSSREIKHISQCDRILHSIWDTDQLEMRDLNLNKANYVGKLAKWDWEIWLTSLPKDKLQKNSQRFIYTDTEGGPLTWVRDSS